MTYTVNGYQSRVNLAAEIEGYLNDLLDQILTGRTAFGESSVAENTAFIQAAPVYNLLPANFRTFNSGTGSAGVENKMFYAKTSTTSGDYGAIQSFRSLNYKPGQGGLARFTAIFETNVANSWQGVGLVNLGDELSFGYSGTAFGIWHRHGGVAEVRTVTVSGAAGGSENLTLTLNGTGYTIPLTSGTTAHNAYEIADWLNSNQSVWAADQIGSTVVVTALSDGAKSGSYSFSSSTATGSIAQTTAGVTKTSTHVPQASWNGDDIFDGNGDSGVTLDPTSGNVYQIAYQYLGFGAIKFYIENPTTGDFALVHTIRYSNANTSASMGNPSLHLGMYCVSLGSTTALTVRSASMAAFVQGRLEKIRNPRSISNEQTLSTTNETNVLCIKNRRSYNGYANQVEIEPISITLANECNKSVIVRLRASSDFNVEQNFTEAGTNLVSLVDTTASNITAGTKLAEFTVAPSGQSDKDLTPLEIRIPPSLGFSLTAQRSSGSSGNVIGTVTWYEDI